MKASGVNVWLVNTGWTGGPYGTGSRMKLKYTRAMISAAIEGKLNELNLSSILFLVYKCRKNPKFLEVLCPRDTWQDQSLR